MRDKYAAKVPQMAAAYDASKGRAIQNYRGPEGVTIGPRTRAAYEDGVRRAQFRLPADAADRMVANYARRMAE